MTNSEEVIKVRVQKIFPNCEKYKIDCGKHTTGKCNVKVPMLAFGQPLPKPKTIDNRVFKSDSTKHDLIINEKPDGFEDVKVNDL